MLQFETGTIDVRRGHFDHHSAIEHSQAFIAKMASVQLVEWFVMTSQDPEVLEHIEFNHFGHIDDLVALALPVVAKDRKKVQSLYRFALEASVLDSCGPAGYALVSQSVKETVDACLGKYHHLLKAKGTNAREATLTVKRASMALAAMELVARLDRWAASPAEIELNPLPEGTALVEEKFFSSLRVALVTISAADINIFRHAAWLYSQGFDLIVAENHGRFSVMAASNYSTDLSGLWEKLTAEDHESWGGHAGAGGSPRNADSSLNMSEVAEVVESYLSDQA